LKLNEYLQKNKDEMQNKRLASFLPSSTEILYELDLADQIVGVTHECNYPEGAKTKPRLINSSFDAAILQSIDIDKKIAEMMKTGQDIYVIDDEKLRKARPDIIIAQGICDVCAPSAKEIDRAVTILGYKPDILVLDPHDLDDILHSIISISEKVNKVEEGHKMVASLQKRINHIANRVSNGENIVRKNHRKANVICIEWIDPFYTAGHWVPQMVTIAGGINGISSRGKPSRRMSMNEIELFDPDKIVLMPCGFNLNRTLSEVKILDKIDNWKSLQAVQNNEVYVVNANAYFSKPGPRTIVGLEILAKIINPSLFEDLYVPPNSFTKLVS
jgi:iron complex transport system substrate-binding protein